MKHNHKSFVLNIKPDVLRPCYSVRLQDVNSYYTITDPAKAQINHQNTECNLGLQAPKFIQISEQYSNVSR